jgi:serine/threonine-protein kinase PRP4
VGFAVDMWSTACSIFEMFTGKLLFSGETNNESLRQMMVLQGPFSIKMLKKCEFVSEHFDLATN